MGAGQAVREQMLTADQERKMLTAWAADEVASLRRDFGAWEVGVTAADLAFTAWRADGTGEQLAARDPRRLRDLIATAESRAGAPS